MRQYTGKSSHQISAYSKFNYFFRKECGKPTAKQSKYLAHLKAICSAHKLDVGEAMGHMSVKTRSDCSEAIVRIKEYLKNHGVKLQENDSVKEYRKRQTDYYTKRNEEVINTDWIYLDKAMPDRHFVKALMDDGRMLTLEWDGKNFLDPYGNPIVTGKHRFNTPIAWARLG